MDLLTFQKKLIISMIYFNIRGWSVLPVHPTRPGTPREKTVS